MRKYVLQVFAVLIPLLLIGCLRANAQQCQPVQADKLVAEGVAAIQNGTAKGEVLQGAQAVTFAKSIGLTVNVVAVFLIHSGEDDLLLIVFKADDGTEGVCYGKASDAAKQAISKIVGRGA